MREPERVFFTNMCMVRDGEKVLVENRVDPKWRGLCFPGGHVEKEESFVEAVKREVREETGAEIDQLQLCGVKDFFPLDGTRYVVLFYRARYVGGEIRSSREGTISWMTLEEMCAGRMVEDMPDMLRVFTDEELTEMYYTPEGKMSLL